MYTELARSWRKLGCILQAEFSPVLLLPLVSLIWQVIYGSAIIDPTSLNVLSALVDHWIHTGGPKREVGRYHIPQQFFIPTTKLNALVQAVETANPPLVLTAELCGLYFSPIVSDSRLSDKFPIAK